MPIQISRASQDDLEILLNIEKQCFSGEAFALEQISSLMKSPNAVSLVARIDAEVTGFIIGLVEQHNNAAVGHICTLDVAVPYRRMGVGLKLLQHLEQAFLEKGVETFYLEVRAGNRAARELYYKHGYRQVEPLENFYSKDIHGIRMKKEIQK